MSLLIAHFSFAIVRSKFLAHVHFWKPENILLFVFQVPKALRMPTAAFSLIYFCTTTRSNRLKSNSLPRGMVRSASIPTFTIVVRCVSVCSVPGAVPDGNRPRAPFYKFWLAFRGSFLCPIPISMNPGLNTIELRPVAK